MASSLLSIHDLSRFKTMHPFSYVSMPSFVQTIVNQTYNVSKDIKYGEKQLFQINGSKSKLSAIVDKNNIVL